MARVHVNAVIIEVNAWFQSIPVNGSNGQSIPAEVFSLRIKEIPCTTIISNSSRSSNSRNSSIKQERLRIFFCTPFWN